MEIFYQLFYTVFSMSCMLLVLMPVVLVLRFIFRRLPGQFSMALWQIFYLRAVCPVGMSSPVCLFGKWNRWFHILLRSIGLKMTPDRGLMTGWFSVFQSQLEVSVPYRICTFLWLAGVVVLFMFTGKKQADVRKRLKDAEFLFDRVYLSAQIQSPVRIGIIQPRFFFPQGFSAKELKNMLLHQQLHSKRKDDWLRMIFFIISCIHWWNPCVWLAYYLSGKDRETSCDDAVIRRIGWSERKGYAQDILNMKKGEDAGGQSSLITFREDHLPARAERVLYMEPSAVWKKAVAAFVLTLCLFCWFMLSALHTAWNGGQWRKTETVQEETLFVDDGEQGITNQVIASCESQTPKGNAVKLELLMTQGTYQRDAGYTGQCILRMKDEEDTTLSSLILSKVFSNEKVQVFNENIKLSVDDYNEDGVMEVSIGQKMNVAESELAPPASGGAVTGKTAADGRKGGEKITVYGYYLVNLEEDELRVISDPVYVSDATELQAGSILFSYIEDAGGIITTELEGKTAYYVWDTEEKMYTRRKMTQQEINERTSEKKTDFTEGETSVYSLKNRDDLEVVRVAAQTDQTGGQAIENVSINPKGIERVKGLKSFTNVNGYFSKIEWATVTEEEEQDRYAVLTFTGDTGQTFVIYDVEKRKTYYQQEEGNDSLAKIFADFNETDIVFGEEDMVVYSLMEIRNDVLRIGFAANAEKESVVRGSYRHNITTGKNTDFQYSKER